jgi:hypothetical protein
MMWQREEPGTGLQYGYKAKILFELWIAANGILCEPELALISVLEKVEKVQEFIAANIGLLTHQGDKEGLHNYQVQLAQLGLDFPVA